MTISDIQQTAPWEWGDTEREELIAVLRDPGASVAERALAAELAGETVIVDDEIAGLLLAIARNAEEPEEVRSSAAIGLGPALEEADTAEITNGIVGEVDVDSPISAEVFASIKAGLREVVEDESAPALVRRRALEAVRAPAPWQREQVGRAFAAGDRDWRRTAVFCAGYLEGFDDDVMKVFHGPWDDDELLVEAVVAAGNSSLDSAWSHVVEMLSDDETPRNVLVAAIGAAPKIDSEEAGPVLSLLADATDDPEIRELALEAMMEAAAIDGDLDDVDDDEFDDDDYFYDDADDDEEPL